MPTILSHALVPLAVGLGLGRRRAPAMLVAAGMAAAMLPDIDVLAFRLELYAPVFGHRGASHALVTAATVGLAGALLFRSGAVPFRRAFLFLFAATASHGLLDMLTNGGHGIELFWPFSEARLFAPWRPIEVSPLGLRRFFSAEGLAVLASEALWLWVPCLLLALGLRLGLRLGLLRASRGGSDGALDKHP